jgi:phosphatidylserine/phosphatidylglycerophosphate/cardiolipin synthase-like enzyme
MNFLSKDIGRALSVKLAQTDQVQIASAFFSPSDSMLVSLNGISHLRMVISEEFTVNDPYKLARLNPTFIRSVPTYDAKGKLHAKVFIAKLRDRSTWVLLGSANLTQQGLFANQEACVEMHSTNPEDRPPIARIESWFDDLFERARPIDIASACEIFDQRSRYRLEPRPLTQSPTPIEYWAIKTTSGGADAEELSRCP